MIYEMIQSGDDLILSIKNDHDDKYPLTFGLNRAIMLEKALKEHPDLLKYFIRKAKRFKINLTQKDKK